ncbi:glycosyltransferase family 2 protein [Campylobacter concisus]|uniref:Putative two-domain protein glycosyltransferase n=1 Tax=Campylobacter concisus ATCC 51562 TaxID=1242969 RepID=U2GGK3_9BACT|nr:glycosyltransferase family 2 protein [Campylobacter concisus]ERJ25088.1 Putative two-domain protein glycosyltransferase [Campylobacter concisus ATCC 51562]
MLSVVILTFNSQKHLQEVLESTNFADEVIVVDSGSKDSTRQICDGFINVRFHEQTWLGFGAQKQKGVDLAKNEWIFVLDSDEVITNELQDEIISTLKEPKFMAYNVARLNFFFGKAIKNMGLYPDYTVRLFNKNFAGFDGRAVHEKVILNDDSQKLGALKNHFLHYAYESIEQFIAKQNRYSSMGAKKNLFKALTSPAWTFFKLYVLKGGFKEGFAGYVIARLYAQYTFWKYIK